MAEIAKPKPESFAGKVGRGAAFNRDWTEGSIIRNLFSLSWPILISDGLKSLGPTVDLIWVGKLGAASVAGVGISSMAVWAVMAGMTGISMGMRAMIARFVGAGDTQGANHVAQQALIVSAIYTVVMSVIGIIFSEQILSLFGVEADVVSEGAAYMRIMLAGTAAVSFYQTTEGIMQASGDAVNPMRISIIYRIFHIILCPFLIFGWWIFPRMGVSGAAVSNVVSQSVGMVLGLLVLFIGRSRLRLTLSNFRVDLNIIWRIIRIGVPAAVMMAERSFGRLIMVWFMAQFGTDAVAAHSVIQRLVMFITMIGTGFGRGAGVLVGQNMGARRPERAEKSAWLAVGFAECVMLVFSMAMLLWPASIIRIFSSEPGLVEVGSNFIRIGVVGWLVISIDQVLMQALSGAGDTLTPMLITLLSSWAVLMPLAYFLPRVTDLGVYGVRWAMVIGLIAGVVAYLIYFRLGRWKYKRV